MVDRPIRRYRFSADEPRGYFPHLRRTADHQTRFLLRSPPAHFLGQVLPIARVQDQACVRLVRENRVWGYRHSRTTRDTRGYFCDSKSMIAGRNPAEIDSGQPIFTSPAVGSLKNSMSLTPCRNSSNAPCTRVSRARPNCVSSTPPGPRSNNLTPSDVSRLAMTVDTDGCVMPKFSRGLGHAAPASDREEYVQFAQLEAAADVLFPMDMTCHSPAPMGLVVNRIFYL